MLSEFEYKSPATLDNCLELMQGQAPGVAPIAVPLPPRLARCVAEG